MIRLENSRFATYRLPTLPNPQTLRQWQRNNQPSSQLRYVQDGNAPRIFWNQLLHRNFRRDRR